MEQLLGREHLAGYVDGWGRPGDRALVATLDGEPVGGVLSRLFSSDRPGQGFVDEATPELGIGLFEGSRSTGIGRALMLALIAQARVDRYPCISLAVANDNRAKLLYQSLGFDTVREVAGGCVMVLRLDQV
jgi:ribosomal protein S18 acetylase RimI-like enzyme